MTFPAIQKPLALSMAMFVGLSGCQVFKKSDTWDTAMRVRPGEAARDPDPSNAYAAKLHGVLADRGIEHKVVVYQYRYTTRLREEAVGTRTAVIYRDDSDSRYPWWIKDDRLSRPVWLPNGELDKQVSFYLRRDAEIIEAKDYPGQADGGKAMLAFARPAPKLRPAAAQEKPVAEVTPIKKAPVPIVVREAKAVPVVAQKPARISKPTAKTQPAPANIVAKAAPKPAAPKISAPKRAIKGVAIAKPVKALTDEPAQPELAPIAVPPPIVPAAAQSSAPSVEAESQSSGGSRSTLIWNPPAILDPAEQSHESAPRNRELEKLFRTKHGTDYNPFSPNDRRKMEQLKHGLTSRLD